MRYIKDFENNYCKTQLYAFNNKYIIKFEAGMLEQVFKISEMDISGESEIDEILNEEFLKKVMLRFIDMQNDLDAYIF